MPCSPDGRVLAVGQLDGSVTLTDARTLRPRLALPGGPDGPGPGHRVRARRQAARRRRRRTASSRWSTRAAEDREAAARPPRPRRLTPSFSADGRLMATGSAFDSVRLWALPSGRTVGRPLRGARGRPCRSAPTGGRWPRRARRRGCRDPRRADAPAPRDAARVRGRLGSHPLHPRRALPPGRQLEGLGAAVVHQDVEAGRSQVHRARRPRGGAVREPGRPHARHRRPGRHDPPLGPAHAAAARRRAAGPAEQLRRPAVHTRTASTCSPSTETGGQAYRWDVRPSSWARQACTVAGRPLTPIRVARRPARARLRPGLHALTRGTAFAHGRFLSWIGKPPCSQSRLPSSSGVLMCPDSSSSKRESQAAAKNSRLREPVPPPRAVP